MAGRHVGVLCAAFVLLVLGLPPASASALAQRPAPARNLAAYQSQRGVTIEWTNPRRIDGDVARIARGPHAPSTPRGGRAIALSNATATRAVLANLARGTVYSVAVWTRGAGGLSRSSTETFTTHPAPASPATVEGTVTDKAGHPLANAFVGTFAFPGGSASTRTDPHGHYRLTSPPGQAYIAAAGPNATGGTSDRTGYRPATTLVRVPAGRTRRGVDFALRAGGAVRGSVTDLAGHPLAGVQITTVPPQPFLDQDGSSSSAFFVDDGPLLPRTGTRGRYTLKGLDDSATVPCFDPSHVAGRPRSYAARCATGSAAVAPGHSVTMPTVVLSPVSGGRVLGTITDSRGRPVPRATVDLSPANFVRQGFPRDAVADSHGRYDFTGLRGGSWHLCAGQGLLAARGLGVVTGCRRVVVDVTKRVRADLALTQGGALSGVVRGPSGAGVAGVVVDVGPVRQDRQSNSYGLAVTDAHGAYTAGGLQSGAYKVCFQTSQTGGRANPAGLVPSCLDRHVGVSVGRDRIGGDDTLKPGGSVSGVVTDSAGKPLPANSTFVEATTRQHTGGGSVGSHGRYVVSGLAPARYRVCATVVDVSSERRACAGHRVTVAAGRALHHVDIRFPQQAAIAVRVTDSSGHPLSGVEVAAIAPCSMNECRVEPVFNGHPSRVAATHMTGPHGAAVLDGLRPGHYAVCALGYYGATPAATAPTGYADKCTGSTFTVSVTRGATTSTALQLDPGGVVTGRVTDHAGHPLTHVRVRLTGSPTGDIAAPEGGFFGVADNSPVASPFADVYTDATGRYTIHSVRAGQQTLCVKAGSARGGTSSTGYRNTCLAGPVTVTGGAVTSAPRLALDPRAAGGGHVARAAKAAPARHVRRLVWFGGRWYPAEAFGPATVR